MTNKKKHTRATASKPLTGIRWDSLPADPLNFSKVISPQLLIEGFPDSINISFDESFSKSESLFSKDYLHLFGLSFPSEPTALERMANPKEQHLINNEVDTSFWKGNSVFACLFLFMQRPEQEKGLRRFFGPFGLIQEILIMGNHFVAIRFANINSTFQAKKWISNPGYNGVYFPLNNPSSSLWIGNLHPDTTERELYSQFTNYGQIKSIRVFKWKFYAFVNFWSLQNAVDALDCMQGREIRNVAIKLNFATEK